LNVIDASALAKFVLKEEGWRGVIPFLKRAESVDHALKEVANAIWKARRRGFIGDEDASKKFEALLTLAAGNIELVEEFDLLPAAFDLAVAGGITVYDALYVSLARRDGLPLVTSDEAQGKVARGVGVKVILV